MDVLYHEGQHTVKRNIHLKMADKFHPTYQLQTITVTVCKALPKEILKFTLGSVEKCHFQLEILPGIIE